MSGYETNINEELIEMKHICRFKIKSSSKFVIRYKCVNCGKKYFYFIRS